MGKSIKLSDEELSRVLGMHAIGKLDHGTFGRLEGEAAFLSGCGCVAGAALNLHAEDVAWYGRPFGEDDSRAHAISEAAEPEAFSVFAANHADRYAETPDDLLRFLESRGLA